jgi:hypothetical protein
MKQLIHLKSGVTHLKWILCGMLLAGGLVMGPTSKVTVAQSNPNPGVIPPHARAYGLSYAQWGAQWWRWAYSFPLADFPPLQSGELDCGLGQSGSVWFLAGTVGQGPVTRSCTIPAGKALFFPIVGYINDYPCPDPDFQPPPGETLEQFLTEGAQAIIDLVTQLEVVVDGQPLNDPFSYRATSRLFTFTADPSLVVFDSCITGTQQYGVTDGYWIMLRPLPSGPHTIFFRAVIDFGGGSTFEVQVTYNLTIAP